MRADRRDPESYSAELQARLVSAVGIVIITIVIIACSVLVYRLITGV